MPPEIAVPIVPQDLRVLAGCWAVGVAADAAPGALGVVRGPDGLTVVAPAEEDTDDVWVALWSGGSAHGLDTPGMTVSLLAPLSADGLGVFVLSTAEADVVLVPRDELQRAVDVLRAAGHRVRQ